MVVLRHEVPAVQVRPGAEDVPHSLLRGLGVRAIGGAVRVTVSGYVTVELSELGLGLGG